MKNQNFRKINMWRAIIAVFTITLMMSSCSDDDEDLGSIAITIDDAAELVAFSVANRTYGAINNLNYVANNVIALVDCNESETNVRTVNETSTDGEISVTYDISESYAKTCSDEEVVHYSFDADQVLMSQQLNLDQELNGSWTVRGIQTGSTELIYDGTYNRSGHWHYNLENDHTDNVIFSSVLDSLRANAADGRITDGVATFVLNGSSSIHESYNYEGDIRFEGEDVSIITFRSGEQYELNLETGAISRL